MRGGRAYAREAAGLGPPGRGGGEPNEKPSAPLSWRQFLQIVKPYFLPSGFRERLSAAACFLCLALSKACNLVAPVFLGTATDALVRNDITGCFSAVITFGVLRLLVSVFEEFQRLVYLRVKEVAYLELATSTFKHLHDLSLHWHVSKQSGVVLRAMDRGISSASTVVDLLFLRLGPTLVEMLIIVILFGTLYASWRAGLVLTLAFVLYVAVTVYLTRRRTKVRMNMHVADNKASQIAVDAMTGFETVKAFSNEAFELGRYTQAIAAYQRTTRESQSTLVFVNLAQATIMRGAFAGVLLLAAIDIIQGQASLGSFVAVQTYIVNLFAPLSWLGSMYSMINNAMTDMTNLGDLLAEEPDLRDAPDAMPLLLRPESLAAGPEVRFDSVAFSYGAEKEGRIEAQMRAQIAEEDAADASGGFLGRLWRGAASAVERLRYGPRQRQGRARLLDDASKGGLPGATVVEIPYDALTEARGASATSGGKTAKGGGKKGAGGSYAAPDASAATPAPPRVILRDVSFVINPGTTTAVCGQTGAGKSTLARLLFRFYDVVGGAVSIDGQDVRSVTLHSLRSSIGMVPQDCVLFNDTLRYNIEYGRPGASDTEIASAVEAAQLTDFIGRLPQGLETKVGERGLRLSGGERQRVAIARVLLRNPPILVLDEATASLDVGTEAAIQAALTAVRAGRTVLLIAHRLSTVKDAHQIIVLGDGHVIERGTHDELLAMPGGAYRGMWQRQLNEPEQPSAVAPSGSEEKQPLQAAGPMT